MKETISCRIDATYYPKILITKEGKGVQTIYEHPPWDIKVGMAKMWGLVFILSLHKPHKI